MGGRSPVRWLQGGNSRLGRRPGTVQVVWPDMYVTPCHLRTELPATALPSLLPELFQPWLLRGFGAQTQLSLLHQGSPDRLRERPE